LGVDCEPGLLISNGLPPPLNPSPFEFAGWAVALFVAAVLLLLAAALAAALALSVATSEGGDDEPESVERVDVVEVVDDVVDDVRGKIVGEG